LVFESKQLTSHQKIEDKPGRRQFSPEYKLKILLEIDGRREERGSMGEILRREGLYARQVTSWKRDLEEAIAGFKSKKRGPKADSTIPIRKEKEQLERQNRRLREELRQARLIIAAQKKIAEMFPDPKQEDEEHSESDA
jgi:transposase-like protein